jgi:hypothetical protein
MKAKLKVIALALPLSMALAGCAPKEMFSCIDRHCFCADWTNHYSCVSCCCQGDCQQQRFVTSGEVLVLGNQPVNDKPIK